MDIKTTNLIQVFPYEQYYTLVICRVNGRFMVKQFDLNRRRFMGEETGPRIFQEIMAQIRQRYLQNSLTFYKLNPDNKMELIPSHCLETWETMLKKTAWEVRLAKKEKTA